jgi:hypothetical protein
MIVSPVPGRAVATNGNVGAKASQRRVAIFLPFDAVASEIAVA